MGSDTEISAKQAKTEEKEEKRYKCHFSECLAVYNRPSKLIRHIRSHTKERPFKCEYPDCKKDYTNNSHLQRHILVSHKKKNTPIVLLSCPYSGCERQFQNKYSLKKHCKNHNVNLYRCPECGEQFKKKHQLLLHSYQHRGPVPLTCTHCNKKFAVQKELIRHEKRHKVYICEYVDCREEFMTWSSLRKHFKVKHKRLYECEFCKRTFINKNTMMKHVLTHLNLPSPEVYPCPNEDCTRYYKYKKNLTQHMITAHEGKRFECTEQDCKQVFKSKNRLNDHLTRHKNGTLNKPRVIDRTKPRKPRKDKGLAKKSMAALLSGVILPPEVDKCLVQNKITSEVEEDINCTINLLREVPEEDSNDEECINSLIEQPKDPSRSIMYIINSKTMKYL